MADGRGSSGRQMSLCVGVLFSVAIVSLVFEGSEAVRPLDFSGQAPMSRGGHSKAIAVSMETESACDGNDERQCEIRRAGFAEIDYIYSTEYHRP